MSLKDTNNVFILINVGSKRIEFNSLMWTRKRERERESSRGRANVYKYSAGDRASLICLQTSEK